MTESNKDVLNAKAGAEESKPAKGEDESVELSEQDLENVAGGAREPEGGGGGS